MDELQARMIGEQYSVLWPRFAQAAPVLEALLKQVCGGAGLDIERVECRAKTVESLVKKLQRSDEFDSLDAITDRLGGRIVTRFPADVDVARKLISEKFEVIADWSHGQERLESFGYTSWHLLIRLPPAAGSFIAEIQVRSVLQHAWAVISHSLDYKSELEVPSTARRRLFRVAALLETADEIFDSFRQDVEAARRAYQGRLSAGAWGDVPLDLQSLREGIANMDMAQLRLTAEWCGWRRVAAEGTEPVFLTRLLETASAAGIADMREIRDFATRAEEDRKWLKSLADVYRASNGVSPSAVPADLITVRILSERRTDQTAQAARAAQLSQPLIDAATRVPRD